MCGEWFPVYFTGYGVHSSANFLKIHLDKPDLFFYTEQAKYTLYAFMDRQLKEKCNHTYTAVQKIGVRKISIHLRIYYGKKGILLVSKDALH